MGRILLTLTIATLLFLAGSPLGAGAQDTQDHEARALFEAGLVAYESQRFESALMYFQRSHALSGRAKLHYNAGLTLERLGRARDAIHSYALYLQAIPDAANRSEVEGRIASLEQWRADQLPAGGPEPSQGPPRERAKAAETPEGAAGQATSAAGVEGAKGKRRAGIALLASGGALAAAGGVLLGMAMHAKNQVEDAPQGSDWGHVSRDNERVFALSVTGFSLLGAGLVSGIVGGVLWFGNRQLRIDVALAPRAFQLQGRF